MSNKQTKTSLVIGEIKTIITYHFTTANKARIKKADNNKCSLGYGEIRP